jgi:hypothetical protein
MCYSMNPILAFRWKTLIPSQRVIRVGSVVSQQEIIMLTKVV